MAREALYLSRADIENLKIPTAEVIRVLEEAFKEKGEGTVEQPPKLSVHIGSKEGMSAMPAYIRKMGALGVKWLSSYPENYRQNLPYIHALAILNDPNSGLPLSIMDSTWITAMRTGAATAIAAKKLARTNPRTLGILGCGVEGRSNLDAIATVFTSMKEVRAYDTNVSVLQKYLSDAAQKYGIETRAARNPREAVVGSDIVVTAVPISKPPQPVIEDGWLGAGGFACALDLDSSWTPAAVRAMDKFYTDDTKQMAQFRSAGYCQDIPDLDGELAEIISGKKKGRENDQERNMAMFIGLGMEDIATAKLIYDTAEKEKVGIWLKL